MRSSPDRIVFEKKIFIWINHFFIFYCEVDNITAIYWPNLSNSDMKRVQFTQEFLFRASPTILYKFLTTPSCLIRWFCDEVDIQGDTYTFMWQGSEEIAEIIDDIEEELIRFHWEEAEDEEEFLEFKITKSPVTGETILEITDFCDEDEQEDQQQLWISQMRQLKAEMGG
jgi:uncharacterized protein YndB with AHSA1/START domain